MQIKVSIQLLKALLKARTANTKVFLDYQDKFSVEKRFIRPYPIKYIQKNTNTVGSTSVSVSFFTFIKYLFLNYQALKNTSNDKVLLLVISGSRTIPNNAITDMNHFMDEITFDFSGKNYFKFFREETNKTIIFDTDGKSKLWGFYEDLYAQQVIIIDKIMLFLWSIMNIHKVIFYLIRYANPFYKGSFEVQKESAIPMKEYLGFSFFLCLYKTLLNYFSFSKVVFTTSNSRSIEYLRYSTLENDNCKSVVEFLHGVVSYDFLDYFKLICANPKHKLVHLIPFKNDLLKTVLVPDSIINLNMSKALFAKSYVYQGRFNETLLKKLLPNFNLTINNDVILQIIGNHCHDEDFFASDIFSLECYMIDLFYRLLIDNQKSVKIIYCPHPQRAIIDFQAHPFFADKSLHIANDTAIVSYLSDISISILSTAIFEAKMIGAEVFTPITEKDNFYHKTYLDYILTRESGKSDSLESIIRFAFQKMDITPAFNLIERANERFKKIITTK